MKNKLLALSVTFLMIFSSIIINGDLGTYSWEGKWDGGSSWGVMDLVQNGATLTGNYTHDSGRINGTISGNKVTGTWSEAPSYKPSSDAGDFEMTMSADGKSFTGQWRYGSTGSWKAWSGKRTTAVTASPTITTTPTTTTTTSKNMASPFDSGVRLSWVSVSGLGYRLFRSTVSGELGISVTDFYITSTSYADVNVEPNTTYYYSVKPVIAEARPFEGIEEQLGDIILVFTVKTGGSVYKPGSFKHFIMLEMDNPMMTDNGTKQEIDPGRGTTPLIISGRTMVPIRAIVEAMGGTLGWDNATSKITLKARGNVLEMWLNKTDILINGVSQKMDVAPVSRNGRTYVPVRFAAENLQSKVDYINSTREAVIIFEE